MLKKLIKEIKLSKLVRIIKLNYVLIAKPFIILTMHLGTIFEKELYPLVLKPDFSVDDFKAEVLLRSQTVTAGTVFTLISFLFLLNLLVLLL